jgi:hypothetical protein
MPYPKKWHVSSRSSLTHVSNSWSFREQFHFVKMMGIDMNKLDQAKPKYQASRWTTCCQCHGALDTMGDIAHHNGHSWHIHCLIRFKQEDKMKINNRFKKCEACQGQIDTSASTFVKLHELYFHSECMEAFINGDARGSEGDQVVVPELLASVGLL